MWAARGGHTKVVEILVEILLKKGADLNYQNEEGETVLFAAARGGKVDIINILIQHGANPNHLDKRGRTALFNAAEKDRVDAINNLIQKHKANPNHLDKCGHTALDRAVKKDNTKAVATLTELGAIAEDDSQMKMTNPFEKNHHGEIDNEQKHFIMPLASPKIEVEELPPDWYLDISDNAVLQDIIVTCKIHIENEYLLGLYDKLASEIVELGPEGFNFIKPVSLTIPIKGEPMYGQHTEALTSQDGRKWSKIDPIDNQEDIDGHRQISINHFSWFVLVHCYDKVSMVVDGTEDKVITSKNNKKIGLTLPRGAVQQSTEITMLVVKIPSKADPVLLKGLLNIGDIIHFVHDQTPDENIFHDTLQLRLPFPNSQISPNNNHIRIFEGVENNEWIDITEKKSYDIQYSSPDYISLNITNLGGYVAVYQKQPCDVESILERIISGICYTHSVVFMSQMAVDWRNLWVGYVSKINDAELKDRFTGTTRNKYMNPQMSEVYLKEGQKIYLELEDKERFQPIKMKLMKPMTFYANFESSKVIAIKFKSPDCKTDDIRDYITLYSPENEHDKFPPKCRFEQHFLFTGMKLQPELSINRPLQNADEPLGPAHSFTQEAGHAQTHHPINVSDDFPRHIMLLIDEWGSSKGGLSTLNRELANHLAQAVNPQGTRVSCVLTDMKPQDGDEASNNNNFTIFEAPNCSGMPLIGRFWPTVMDLPSCDQPDVIVGHSLVTGPAAKQIQEKIKCVRVHFLHTNPQELSISKLGQSELHKGREKLQTEIELCEGNMTVVAAVGPRLKDDYQREFRVPWKNKKVFNLVPGLFEKLRGKTPSDEESRRASVFLICRCKEEDFKVKGLDIAADAIAAYKVKHGINGKDIILTIVGAQPGKIEETRSLFEEKTKISAKDLCVLPFEDLDKVRESLFKADLLLMPSRTEGYGLIALEAISAALPVLISKDSGLAMALDDAGKIGDNSIVRSDDPKDWADKIHDVLDKPRKRRILEAERLRNDYHEKYTWENACRDLLKTITNNTRESKVYYI